MSGGPEGKDIAYAVRLLKEEGAVVTESGDRPWHHRVAGCGVGHDDFVFATTGRSMAAYYENGEAFGGRWWETDGLLDDGRDWDVDGSLLRARARANSTNRRHYRRSGWPWQYAMQVRRELFGARVDGGRR
jgi:hypothetical protein